MNKIAFLLLVLIFSAFAQKTSVAVLPSESMDASLSNTEENAITNKMREAALNVLPAATFTLLNQDAVIKRLGGAESYIKECRESSCIVDLGKKAQVDYVAKAVVSKLGDKFMLNVELYNVSTSGLVGVYNGEADNAYGLLGLIGKNVPDAVFRKIPGASRASSGVPAITGGIRDLESAAGGTLDYGKRYLANVSSQPAGAALSFDGVPVASCAKTPCKVELMAGNVRIIAALDQHETLDTTVSVTHNNQNIVLPLKSNFGILEIKPAYLGGIGASSEWNLIINGNVFRFGANKFSPGEYDVKLSHKCYEDLSFKVGINKGLREVFDMSGLIKLKEGGLSLSAERDGVPVSEPVIVNGKPVGDTPFDGPVPLCSKVEIGSDLQAVDVELKHNERVAYKHIMRERGYDDSYKPSFEQSSKSKTGFWVALALDVLGVSLLYYGTALEGDGASRYHDYISLGPSASRSQFGDAWQKVEDAKTKRNTFYAVGAVVLVAGIGAHIWF